jgi:modification methylase
LSIPFYEDEAVTIYHADCMDVLGSLPPADLIFTSPPYNLGAAPWDHLGHWTPGDPSGSGNRTKTAKWARGSQSGDGAEYADHVDAMPHAEYVRWQHAALRAMWDQLSSHGAIFYNHKPRVIGTRMWSPLELSAGLPLRQIVTWARSGGTNFTPTAFMSTYEWLMIFAKDDWRLRDRSASGIGDVWRVPQEPSEHPAPFPLGLPRRAIEATTPVLVLDPFMGSGTTLRAAKDAGVRAIGIDISERYCEMAARRCAQEVLC